MSFFGTQASRKARAEIDLFGPPKKARAEKDCCSATRVYKGGLQDNVCTRGLQRRSVRSAVAICSVGVQCQGQSAVPVNTMAEQIT